MKAKTLDEEGQKAVAKMIENGYVMEDDKEVKIEYHATEYDPEENPIHATGYSEAHWEDPNEVNDKVDFIKESISKGAARPPLRRKLRVGAETSKFEGDELPTVINSPDTNAELAIPIDTPPKEVKLHKTPLKVLTDELERIRLSYTVRNGGMRGIPKSIRNRINRLEKVIGIKTEVYKRAMEQANESGRISENT